MIQTQIDKTFYFCKGCHEILGEEREKRKEKEKKSYQIQIATTLHMYAPNHHEKGLCDASNAIVVGSV